MAIRAEKELNPYFEMIGLLYDSVHSESMEEMWKRSARDRGINPEELAKKIGPVTKKYHAVFQKYMTGRDMEDFEFFFFHEEEEFILFFQSVCGKHPEWFETELKDSQKEEIQLAVIQEISETEKFS